MRPTLSLPARIRSYEVDQQGRLRAPVLCQLLQEAATIHAAELGVAVESLIGSGVAWVLTRLRLVMERWPTSNDEVVVETWPEALDRLTTERRFEIRGSGGKHFGAATTLWLVLDLHRRRPIRIPSAVSEALSKHGLGDRPQRLPELEVPDSVDAVVEFTVRRSDVDLAGHANNTSYVEWALEAVHDEVWEMHELAGIDLGYRSECHRGSVIVSGCQRVGGNDELELAHRLVRAEDGETAAVARTVWRFVD